MAIARLAFVLFLLSATAASAQLLLMGIGQGGGSGPTGNAVLLVNNTDPVFLVNSSSDLCLAASPTC